MDGVASSSAPSPPHSQLSPPQISNRTSSKTALRDTYCDDASPSSTPKNTRRRSKKGRPPALRAHREDNTREPRPAPQHSHGLSWSSTTRDSVVDNLLLSLGNLSRADLPDMGSQRRDGYEKEKYMFVQGSNHPMTRPAQRARGHTYSSSLSSNHDRHAQIGTPSSKYSSSTYRSRRSNSSSNFGGHPRTTDGARPSGRLNGIFRSSSETQRPLKSMQTNGKVAHGRNQSDDSMLEYGYGAVLETSRLAWGGRSVSMDHIYSEATPGSSILDRGRPVPPTHSKYDGANDENACPEPGVPAGPRKKLNPTATGPVYVNAGPQQSSTLRKITNQGDLRSASNPNPAILRSIRSQATDFVRASSIRGSPDLPPMPNGRSAPAPGPAPARTRRKDTYSPYRERPGFFKRVFGGSARTNSASSDRSPSRQGPDDVTDIPGGRPRPQLVANSTILSATKDEPKPYLPNESAVTTSYPPLILNKKPSSFFRRRKKSNAEDVRAPPLPLNSSLNLKAAEPSPSISSLRKVMDPFLGSQGTPGSVAVGGVVPANQDGNSSRPAPGASPTEESDDLSIFHSGYTPPRDASLGKRFVIQSEPPVLRPGEDNNQNSSQTRLKVKKRKQDLTSLTANGSLQGSSSRELYTTTIRENFLQSGEPMVSPLSEVSPTEPPPTRTDDRPASRASTGDRIIASKGTSPIEPNQEMRGFTNDNHTALNVHDDEYVVTARPFTQERPDSKKSERLLLQPTHSEETLDNGTDAVAHIDISRGLSSAASTRSQQKSPSESRVGSAQLQAQTVHSPITPSTRFHSATSLPLVQIDCNEPPRQSIDAQGVQTPYAYAGEDAEYKERARKIFRGDEEDVTKMEAAAWLGERNTLSTRTLTAYMKLFDFTGYDLLSTLRTLCGKLLLKGETQQFDRIITALSARWCECNPNHGFKAQDVVHTIFYSLILLNTDLHLADIGEKMSRSAYVKNTLPTIRRVVTDAAPNAFDETVRPSPAAARPTLPCMDSNASIPSSPSFPPDTPQERTSFEQARPAATKRLSIRPGFGRIDSDGWTPESAGGNMMTALVNSPWTGTMRGWEFEIESMLKSFFVSIRGEPLPLLGMQADLQQASDRNLSVGNFGLKRSGSVVSKSPSDNMLHRSKPGFRTMTMGFRANVSKAKVYSASTIGSSRTSLDDGNSVWSPAQSSSNWSKNSFGRTLTSTSVSSLGYHLSPCDRDYKHSIGFANALSQAIIREEGGTNTADTESALDSLKAEILDDESLTLQGAPWAKEGLVKHKHHLESPDRKAKQRSWNDCFAVISKGKLTLFAFNTDAKSRSLGRTKALKAGRAASMTATTVGGGDWMENAEQLDSFRLRQTIASTLPPPGYSKVRPHVWALSLPSGAVHLFQVGTPEIANEWMSTANYWSARLSKEPLSGGISNIEYGWSDQVINTALLDRSESSTAPPSSLTNKQHGHMHSSSNSTVPRPSMQSSMRGSLDVGGGSKARLLGDKVHLTDWHPPSQSMMASQLMEVDQLGALTAYVTNVEGELEKHNELKHAIELAYSPRHANCAKAMTNWQRKSEYLLREIVKFRTYIDSLAAAQRAKEDFYARKAESKAERELAKNWQMSPLDGYFTADEQLPADLAAERRDMTPKVSKMPN